MSLLWTVGKMLEPLADDMCYDVSVYLFLCRILASRIMSLF